MSATIYGALQWCKLTPEEITGVVKKIVTGFIYKGEDFYNEVKALDGWRDANQDDKLDDGVVIWDSDDAGPIMADGKEVGLFVHFNEDTREFDWACTYEYDR